VAEATIGPFRLLRRVGAGASGEVFLAHAATPERRVADAAAPERRVALKLYRVPHDELTADAVQRFESEVQLLRRLRHPGIVEIIDAGLWQQRPWLAMAWLPGHDLSRYTTPARLLPEPLVLHIGEQIARALAHLHRHGVVHRDVKPGNVRVHLPTSSAVLTDFGIARAGDGVQTDTGVVPGSPAFMAPELLAGAAPDAASDLYALGVNLFQLLSARLPFEATSMGELLRRAAHDEAPTLDRLRPGVAPALTALVARLLARRHDERAADAAAVAEALRALRETA